MVSVDRDLVDRDLVDGVLIGMMDGWKRNLEAVLQMYLKAPARELDHCSRFASKPD